MSGFLNACEVRVIEDCHARPTLQLINPLLYQSDLIGQTIECPAGMVFDGCSVPTLGMGIVGWPAVRAGCVHDHLLTTDLQREVADRVFREALVDGCGVDEFTAMLMYEAVSSYTRTLREQHAGGPDWTTPTA